jgi:phospholipid/cholesterol/gamma-HCH transport system substrate-binding protein
MEYFRTDVKVGGFILIALVLLVFAAIMVGDLGSWFAKKQHYTVLFRDAGLVPEGAQVSYAGYPVGQVTAIEVHSVEARTMEARTAQCAAYPVALTITVRSTVSLYEDSRVEMKTDGMIGDRYINIVPGGSKETLLPPGSPICGTMGGLDGMLASLSGVPDGVEGLLIALQALLTDSKPGSIPTTLTRVHDLLNALQPHLTRLTTTGNDLLQHAQQELVSTSDKAGQVLETLDATLAENRPGLQRLIGELNTTLVDVRHTMDTARELLETGKGDIVTLLQSAQSLVEGLQESQKEMTAGVEKLLADVDAMVVQNDRNVYATIENLRDMTANLEATSELLRANPSVILWGNRGDDNATLMNASERGNQVLQDRGRIGRYDRAQ